MTWTRAFSNSFLEDKLEMGFLVEQKFPCMGKRGFEMCKALLETSANLIFNSAFSVIRNVYKRILIK